MIERLALTWWGFWTEAFNEWQVGNFASVIGLAITIVGFYVTVRNVRRTRTAAEMAQAAAVQVRQSMATFRTVSDLSTVLPQLEEIKKLHRSEEWDDLPRRYALLRKTLIGIRQTNTTLRVSTPRRSRLRSAC